MDTTDTDRPQDAGAATRTGTGAVLRAAREDAGLDLVDVAKVLRIRPIYLQAIEEGRYHDLPGSAYVLGFIRTYSNYLGLDAEEIVRRFKRETEGALNRQPELDFPAPISDGQLPTRAIILGGLIAAALAYGGWYYYNNGDAASQLVSELPERLRPIIEEQMPAAAPEAEAPAADAPESEEPGADAGTPTGEATAAPAVPESEAVTDSATDAADVVEEDTAAEANATAEPSAPPADSGTAEEADGEAEDAAATAPAPSPAAPEAEAASAAPEAAPAEAEEAEAAAVDEPPPPPPTPPERPEPTATADAATAALPAVPEDNGRQASVFGRHNLDSRITILATGEAWIQVRDAENRLLLSRLMREGDRYLVPNRPGLELITGSAGDVQIIVDGQEAPPLGEPGVVRRDIPLDPDYLLAGN